MRREVLVLFFLFTAGKLFASDIRWFEGSLVLSNNKVLCGKISVNMKHDMVLYNANDHVDVYPAHTVRSVHLYDSKVNVNRKFVMFNENKSPIRRSYLYEVVLSGKLSVWRHVKVTSIEPYADAVDFDYYIKEESELVALDKFRTRFYNELLDNGGLIFSIYIKENKLDPNVDADVIRIVDGYNRLNKEERMVAGK
jgi:hypothetical protein